MRPIARAIDPDEDGIFLSVEHVVSVLLDRLGPYCNICEQPLLQSAFAWNIEYSTIISPKWQPVTSNTLLLCPSCEDAQHRAHAPATQLALPFIEPGDSIAARFSLDHGYLFGTDDGTVATVEHFALRRDDTRTAQRQRVWDIALESANELERGSRPEWLGQEIRARGFVSTWIAALGQRLPPGQVRRLINSARDRDPTFYPGTVWERFWPDDPN